MAFLSLQYKLTRGFNRERELTMDKNALKAITEALDVDELFVVRFNGIVQLFLYSEKNMPAETKINDQVYKYLKYPFKADSSLVLTENDAVADFIKKANGIADEDNHVQLIKGFAEDFYQAKEAKVIGPILQRLFQRSIWMHEKVRMNTGYFKIAATLSGVFCELAGKIYESLKGLVVHIAGDAYHNTYLVNDLQRHGVKNFYFSGGNSAMDVLKKQVNPSVTINSLNGINPGTDILIINDDSRELLTEDFFHKRMASKNNAPLLVLCESSAPQKDAISKKFFNTFWYNLDDLAQLVEKNRKTRNRIYNDIEPWIIQEINHFYSWLSGDSRYRFMQIIGRSPKMLELFELISRISQTDITALIQGESGTGKELVARAIHNLSSRSEKPFIAVNCGAIPDNLIESELFGHVKGAFTGAVNNKNGLFYEADQGTMFLDEIAELPQHLQVKILRFLQEGDIKPIGSTQTLHVNVRIIAATNRNLKDLLEKDLFRSDLYYRLNVILLDLPPLRERREDIPILAEYFLRKYTDRFKKDVQEFSPESLKILQEYNWPGNVRELENAVEHAVALSLGKQILHYELPSVTRYKVKRASQNGNTSAVTLKEVEKNHILNILDQTDWDYEKACEILEIGRTTLWRKLKDYGVSQK